MDERLAGGVVGENMITSAFVTLGCSLGFLEKRWMYSQRVSPDFCLQLRRSQELLGLYRYLGSAR
jgi:hypothetical protein